MSTQEEAKEQQEKQAYYSISVQIVKLTEWMLSKVFECCMSQEVDLAIKIKHIHERSHELYEGKHEGKTSKEMLETALEQIQFLTTEIIKLDESQTSEVQRVIA